MSQQITISTVALANLLQQNAHRLMEQIEGVPMDVPYLHGSYYVFNVLEYAVDHPIKAVEMVTVFRSGETYKRMTCEENKAHVYAGTVATDLMASIINHYEQTYEMIVWAPNCNSHVSQQYFLPGLARNGRLGSSGNVIVDRDEEKFEIPLSSKYLRELGHFNKDVDRCVANGQEVPEIAGIVKVKELVGYVEIRRGGRSQQK